MNVTRTLISDAPAALLPICKAAGFLRADLWRRYGGIKIVGKSASAVRSEIVESGIYHSLALDGTIRSETTKAW